MSPMEPKPDSEDEDGVSLEIKSGPDDVNLRTARTLRYSITYSEISGQEQNAMRSPKVQDLLLS